MNKITGIRRLLTSALCITLLSSTINALPVSAEEVKTKKSTTEGVAAKLPTSWDLTDIYENLDVFEEDMKRAEELLPEVDKLRGTLNSVEGILNSVENPKIIELKAILDKAAMFSELLESLDASDPMVIGVSSRFNEVAKKYDLAFSFYGPEIMEMPIEERQRIFSDKRLADYSFYFRDYTDPDYRIPSEDETRAVTVLSTADNSSSVYSILDYIDRPQPSFTYPDGTRGVLSDTVYSRVVSSDKYDQSFREQLYKLRSMSRQQYKNTYAALLDGQMKFNWGRAQIYGYDSTLAMDLKEEAIEPEVYDRIIQFANSMDPKFSEYYRVKKDMLGLDKFMPCDISLPVTKYSPKEVSYDEAVTMGRAGISVWGDEYLKAFDEIITSPHVDVYPADRKNTGAFETLMGNETLPFVLLNFDGTEGYTSTVVHEMGHAVYSRMSAQNQNAYNNNPTIFTQEVASTANEIMFAHYMADSASSKDEKMYWLDQEIGLFWGTLMAQVQISEFEDYCYKVIENGGSLSADDLSEKWLQLQRKYYGDNVTIPDYAGIDWARIPHLYYNYYVYKYATSITYAASICKQVEEKGQDEIDAYMQFLKAGNSASPSELLAIAGVDPLDDATYEAARNYIEDLIDEFVDEAEGTKSSPAPVPLS